MAGCQNCAQVRRSRRRTVRRQQQQQHPPNTQMLRGKHRVRLRSINSGNLPIDPTAATARAPRHRRRALRALPRPAAAQSRSRSRLARLSQEDRRATHARLPPSSQWQRSSQKAITGAAARPHHQLLLLKFLKSRTKKFLGSRISTLIPRVRARLSQKSRVLLLLQRSWVRSKP